MTNTVLDKEKRSHGVLWYVEWMLFLYAFSYPVSMILMVWLAKHDLIGEAALVLGIIYFPINMLLFVIGLGDPLAEFLNGVMDFLP